jgi:hypothetical protein
VSSPKMAGIAKISSNSLFYGPMSDKSHVNAAAIGGEISSLLRGDVTIGGRFDTPFLVVLTVCETISHAAEVIDKYFSIGSSAARSALDNEMKRAIGTFVASSVGNLGG